MSAPLWEEYTDICEDEVANLVNSAMQVSPHERISEAFVSSESHHYKGTYDFVTETFNVTHRCPRWQAAK